MCLSVSEMLARKFSDFRFSSGIIRYSLKKCNIVLKLDAYCQQRKVSRNQHVHCEKRFCLQIPIGEMLHMPCVQKIESFIFHT